jgi:hypothetical protein
MKKNLVTVKQIIPADHWWVEYSQDNGISYFEKIIGFAWKQYVDDTYSFDSMEAIADFMSNNDLGKENATSASNFVRIFYSPDFHERLCSKCFCQIAVQCQCHKK